MHENAPTQPTQSERTQAGRALRKIVPRSSQAGWTAPQRRPDPVAQLVAQDKVRIPELVPIRHGRMAVSPFTFLRGAAAVMARDLSKTPSSGIRVQCCGDAHLLNFGAYATPERNLVFDVNDFDETLEAPFEWDVKRLAASVYVAAIDNGFTPAQAAAATTKAMGSGSTQHQHLVQTEVPPKVLTEWLAPWCARHGITDDLRVQLRPHTPGSQILELAIFSPGGDKLANIVFSEMEDRSGRTFLSVRDQNTFDLNLRRKRLMTLMHLFLIHRYKAEAIHYLTPTDDNRAAAEALTRRGLFSSNYDEVGDIIVADINAAQVAELVKPDSPARQAIIDGV